MNRVRIVDLPGLRVEPFVKGKSAYDLLSAAALRQLIRSQAQAHQIDPDTADLIHAFDSSFTADTVVVCAAANEIAAQFGRYLGCLLLTLKRGDAVNRAARRDWDERHWAYVCRSRSLRGDRVQMPVAWPTWWATGASRRRSWP